MYFKTCPACNEEVHNEVTACPHCKFSYINEKLLLIKPKIEWAERNLRLLHEEIESTFYKGGNTIEIGIVCDRATNCIFHCISKMSLIPQTIPSIAGDVLQNLRSALDHLAYQLFLMGPGEKKKVDHVSFPIFKSKAAYSKGRSYNVNGMHPQAIRAIDAFKPYRGGNEMLWRLHKLNMIDKHRTLITAGTAVHRINIGPDLAPFFEGITEILPLEIKDPDHQIDSYVKPPKMKFPSEEGIYFSPFLKRKEIKYLTPLNSV